MFYAPHDDAGSARWGVACTCREPTQLVVAYVAHYIGLGASEVQLFLDEPQADLEAILDQIPQVKYHVCDAIYWRDHIGKPRPHNIDYRQLINVFEAYTNSAVDWLAHFDVDEFLHTDLSVEDILRAQPEALDYAVVAPRERAFIQEQGQDCLFEGVFRKPFQDRFWHLRYLFGRAGRYVRQGLLGHPHGKSFVRTGRPLVPGIHTPRPKHRRLRGWELSHARLLHFDGLTALHWSGKLLRAAAADGHKHYQRGHSGDDHRAHQIIQMRELGNALEQAWDMHEQLKCIPQSELGRLRILGLVEDYRIDPARDIAALGLDAQLDLSRAAFDCALADQTPQVATWLAKWEGFVQPARVRYAAE